MAKAKQGAGKAKESARDILLAQATGLAKGSVKRLRRATRAWIRWGRGIVDRARQDLAVLTKAPLEEPITERDVALCAAGLDELTALAQGRRGAAVEQSDQTQALGVLRDSLKGARKTLLAGFELRAVGNPALRSWVRHIRRGRNDADLETDLQEIVTASKKPQHAAWIATAPNGEADALRLIESKAATFAALTSATGAVDAQGDLQHRVATVVDGILDRLRAAGRYSFPVGDARRKGYAARRPQTGGRKKKGEA